MQISIPLLKSANSSLPTSFEGAYQAFTWRMLLFNMPNAFSYSSGPVKYSQWKFWIWDVGSRHAQNNSWNSQYAASVISWTGGLTAYAKSFDFATNISRIEAGRVKVWAYMDNTFHNAFLWTPKSIFNVNETVNGLDLVKSMAAFPSSMADKRNQKSYVATSPNGTKYMIVWGEGSIRSFVLGATNYDVWSATPNGTYSFTSFPWTPTGNGGSWLNFANVVAAKGQYVWVACVDTFLDATTPPWNYDAAASGLIRGYLFSIDNTGAFTLVGSALTISAQLTQSTTGWSWHSTSGARYYACGSYVKNNTSYCYADYYVYFRDSYGATYPKGTVSIQIYFTVDLTNVTTFTGTAVNSRNINEGWNNGTANTAAWNTSTGEVPVGFNSTNSYMYFILTNGQIWYNTGGGFNNTALTSAAGANDNMIRYRKTPTLMSTAWSNYNFNNAKTGFVIKGVALTWTITNSGLQTIWVYEMTGTNEEDDSAAFKGIMLDGTSINNYSAITEDVSLYINDVLAETQAHTYAAAYLGAINTALPTFTQGNRTFTTNLTVANPLNSVNFELKITVTNSASRNMKLWFWLTGWTYATPTWTNDASWNSTSGWVVWTNGSYIDIAIW